VTGVVLNRSGCKVIRSYIGQKNWSKVQRRSGQLANWHLMEVGAGLGRKTFEKTGRAVWLASFQKNTHEPN